jgi:hypothetical protein
MGSGRYTTQRSVRTRHDPETDMRGFLVALALLTTREAIAGPNPGDPGTPEFQKAAALVRQLGHQRFADREAAAKELVEMGGLAIPALRAGASADDEEVRSRSTALLPRAKAAGWKRRADAFLAEPDAKHDLPLLADWDKLIGKPDAATRKLFAEIVRTNGDFLEEVAADRGKAAAVVATRSEHILNTMRDPKGQLKADAGDLVAVLFVDALAPARLSLSETAPAFLLPNPSWADAMGSAESGPAVRKLLVRWASAQPAYSPVAKVQFADLARRKPFPEAIPILAQLAVDKANRSVVLRLLAIEALGEAGGKEAAAALAALVPDQTVAMRVGPRGDQDGPRYGDLALAASLILHGKKVTDYGLTATGHLFFPPVGKTNIPVTVYSFPSDEARVRAVRQWEAEVAAKGGGKP